MIELVHLRKEYESSDYRQKDCPIFVGRLSDKTASVTAQAAKPGREAAGLPWVGKAKSRSNIEVAWNYAHPG